MSHETEAEALGKSGHLGYGNHLASGATQHHYMGVVDHDPLGGAAEVAQGLGEKHLAIETLEGRVQLKEQQARIAEHGGGGLHPASFAAQLDFVRRSVVLEFLAGREVVASRRHWGRLPD